MSNAATQIMLLFHHWKTTILEWFGMVARTWFFWIPWFIAGSVCTVWFVNQDDVVSLARWLFATSIFRLWLHDRSAEASKGWKFICFSNNTMIVDSQQLWAWGWRLWIGTKFTMRCANSTWISISLVIRNRWWHSFCHHLLQSKQKKWDKQLVESLALLGTGAGKHPTCSSRRRETKLRINPCDKFLFAVH